MEQLSELQIHFYNEYEASVQISTSTQGQERQFSEILLFSSLALRQLRCLGSAPTAVALARILGAVGNEISHLLLYMSIEELAVYVPFVGALGVDISRLFSFAPALHGALSALGGDVDRLVRELQPNLAHLVDYRGVGEKQFIAHLTWENERALLQLKPKGFGIFGRGTNYYVPMSVILLLRYLFDANQGSAGYLAKLTRAANLCAGVYLQGKVSSTSLLTVPAAIALEAVNPEHPAA